MNAIVQTKEQACTKRPVSRFAMPIMMLVLLLSCSLVEAQRAKRTTSWQANWIWCESEESPRNFYLYARKQVTIPAPVERAKFRCTADSRYQLFINGRLVGRGPARSDPRWQSYDEYEVRSHLPPGQNVIAALIHHYGEATASYNPGRGAFLFQGEVTDTNGDILTILSDDTWRVLPSDAWDKDAPRLNESLGFQEIYDARLAPKDWTANGFDDSGWPFATVIGRPPMAPWTSLVARDIPRLREEFVSPEAILAIGEYQPMKDRWQGISDIAEFMEQQTTGSLEAARVENIEALLNKEDQYALVHSSGKDVRLLLDFGKEVVGYPHIRVEGPEGVIIDMGYGEILENGKVNPNRREIKAVDRYTMRSSLQSWETFSKRGFRYMQMDIHNESLEPLKIYSVGLNFSTYPVEYRGAFECSDELLNKIWEVGRYTLELCMQDAYIDGPFREQAQWMGDAHVEALVNYYAFGDAKLIARCLRQIAQSQLPSGMTSAVWPKRWPSEIPDYCLLWIISIWDYYQYTGDEDLVEELYPRVKRALAWFESYVDQHNLLSDVPGWVFIDWAELDKRGEIAALNVFYYKALVDTSQMAELLGEEDKALQYQRLANQVKMAINSRLWDDERGVYLDSRIDDVPGRTVSQQTNCLAVLYNIAGPEKRDRLFTYIFAKGDDIFTQGSRAVPIRTPYFMFYLVRSLFQAGRHGEATRIIGERWGRMLEKGATTFWELLHDGTPSRCHGWSAGPTMLLSSEILGVKPIAPGFEVFRIQPHPGDLDWIRGVVPTPRGDIRVAWQKGTKEFDREISYELTVGVPRESTGEVVIPGLNPTIIMNGVVLWARGELQTKPKETREVRRQDDGLLVVLGEPGEHKLEVQQWSNVSIEGYGGTNWKMPPKEVHQVFPEKDFSDLRHPWMGPQSTTQDKLIDYFRFYDRILDENAEIKFYFFQNQLFKVEVDLYLGDYQSYELLKDLMKRKYGQPWEEGKPADKLRIARWKDERFNTVQLALDSRFLATPRLRITYIDTEIDNTIKAIRRGQKKELIL